MGEATENVAGKGRRGRMVVGIIVALLAIIAAVEFIPGSPGEGFWRAVLGLDGPG